MLSLVVRKEGARLEKVNKSCVYIRTADKQKFVYFILTAIFSAYQLNFIRFWKNKNLLRVLTVGKHYLIMA
jgi:hypothetical protein